MHGDDILGTLLEDPDRPGVVCATVLLDGREVNIRVDPDGGDTSATVAVARRFLASLSNYDRKAREAAAASLLATYNDAWREFEEVSEDGQRTEVSRPLLTNTEFAATLELDSVLVLGKECCELSYRDNDLFWGHSIHVTAFDGESFADLHVELFG